MKHPLVTVTHSIFIGFYKLLGVTHKVGYVSLPVKLRKVVCDGAMGAEDYCVRFWVHWGWCGQGLSMLYSSVQKFNMGLFNSFFRFTAKSQGEVSKIVFNCVDLLPNFRAISCFL